jgi:ABC-type transporter Mla subunit MlaD
MARTPERFLLEARRSTKPLAILIALIFVSLIVGAIIANKLTFQRPWLSYRQVKAEFDDVKGIFPGGDTVRIHGVVAGIVSSTQLVNGHAILTLKLERKYGPIYRDATLRIRPVTPLQDLYVDVEDRGHPSAGEAGGSYVVSASQTTTPVDISRVLDTFDANTRERLTVLLSEMGKGLTDGGVQLRAAFIQLAPFLHVAQQATDVLRRHQQEAATLIHNFGTLSAALATRDVQLNQFVRSGDATMAELASHASPLNDALVQLAALLPTMRSSFASVRALTGTLDPALASLTTVTPNLRGGLVALAKVGNDATPALRALRPAVVDLRAMADQLAPTARSLDVAFGRLQPQAPQIDSLTTQVVPCLPTIDQFFNHTLSVFKYQDANGAFPRADETVDLEPGGAVPVRGLNTRPLPNCAGATG